VSLLYWLAENPHRARTLGKILRLYQRSGLQRLLRASQVLRIFGFSELEANLPLLPPQMPILEIYPAQTRPTGRIVVFTGCLTALTEQQTLTSTIRLLNRLGYEVRVPPDQGCCGALHLHNGRSDKATELMRRNIEAFANATEAVLCAASGCTATLREYGKYLENNQSAVQLSNRVVDINQFLASISWPAEITFRPLAKRIAVHDPCTLTNVLRQEDKPYALLARIPGAEIIPLPENSFCCGAAGTYHLTQTDIARRLRAPKITHLKQLDPDILVTSNPGCATFLAASIRDAGLAIEVTHPVVLLERQMQDTNSKRQDKTRKN
jgi:glycolate oxidase iron-sulfur subunit